MLKAWKDLTPEEVREARARYRLAHPEDPDRKKQTARSYYEKNIEQIKAKNKKWAIENQRKLLAAQLSRLYGITVERFDQMLIEQNGCCGLCGVQMDGPNEPMVDHNHLTGEVRELLCRGCNTGLGMFEDCLDLLELAAHYLRRHGAT